MIKVYQYRSSWVNRRHIDLGQFHEVTSRMYPYNQEVTTTNIYSCYNLAVVPVVR